MHKHGHTFIYSWQFLHCRKIINPTMHTHKINELRCYFPCNLFPLHGIPRQLFMLLHSAMAFTEMLDAILLSTTEWKLCLSVIYRTVKHILCMGGVQFDKIDACMNHQLNASLIGGKLLLSSFAIEHDNLHFNSFSQH